MKINEIVAKVAPTTGMKPNELMRAVDSIFTTIKATVEQGEKVTIAGIGSFVLKSREAGEKVDAETGQKRAVEASSFMAFRPSKGDAGKKKEKKEKDKSKKEKG